MAAIIANLPRVTVILVAQLSPSGKQWGCFSFCCGYQLPSGKRLHNYGKSPLLMGKPTINDHFP